MVDKTDALLIERGKVYGDYTTHAEITQALKDVMRGTAGWEKLLPHQKETLEMNAHKIGRILNGDPNIEDHWADIAGYGRLSADRVADANQLNMDFIDERLTLTKEKSNG